MKSQILHTVWCKIFGKPAGEIWNWSFLGVKGLKSFIYMQLWLIFRVKQTVPWASHKSPSFSQCSALSGTEGQLLFTRVNTKQRGNGQVFGWLYRDDRSLSSVLRRIRNLRFYLEHRTLCVCWEKPHSRNSQRCSMRNHHPSYYM